jgi:ATP-dependent Clp protease, protease subunit
MSNQTPQPQPAQTAKLPEQVHAIFAGFIDQNVVNRMFQNFALANNGGAKDVHILFQSTGGTVSDGICLYNFFKSLPIGLTLYNVGCVSSAALIAYLGAPKRQASANATFMMHRTQSPALSATAERPHSIAHSVAIDNERTESILRQHLKLTDEQWRVHSVSDLWLDAKEALACNLITSIGDFAPPKGGQLFNL